MPKKKKRKFRGKKKDPNRPKRPMSSFMFFANDKRPALRLTNPEMKITQIGKRLGELWHVITPEDKKRYELMHTADLERYKKQMETYVAPPSDSSDDASSKKRRKKAKPVDENQPKQPKRAMSSFMFFSNDKRGEVKLQYPDLKVTEISKKLSEVWKQYTAEDKKRYEDMQVADKERYKKDMEEHQREMDKYVASTADSPKKEDESLPDSTVVVNNEYLGD